MKKNCSSFPSYLPEGIYEVSAKTEGDFIIYTIASGPYSGREIRTKSTMFAKVSYYPSLVRKSQVIEINSLIKE